jgi:hypothetical protein
VPKGREKERMNEVWDGREPKRRVSAMLAVGFFAKNLFHFARVHVVCLKYKERKEGKKGGRERGRATL